MELILHNKWKSLCDAEFSQDNPILPPDGSIVFVHMEHIYEFFKEVSKTDRRYILVSADSDYCLTDQASSPVWEDMRKWFSFIPLDAGLGYNPIVVAPRCNVGFCKLDDMFSIKVYSYTKNTFNIIPENIVHWFSTNVGINYPGITHIPFGIPEWTAELIEDARINGRDIQTTKEIDLYVNFQQNTLERVALQNRYIGKPGVKFVSQPVEKPEFINDLLSSKFVLSPPGNGYDCFRTLEAIYCGAVPVIINAPWNEPYFDLPALVTDDLFSIAKTDIKFGSLEGTKADFGYWRNRIGEMRKNFSQNSLDSFDEGC